MSDSILKFANKLEIRYSFNNKSNYMDAMTKHRCEKEILTLIRSLADMLDVKLTIRRVVSVRSWAWLGRVAALSLSC
mgnify:CR=1 FL=1